MRACRAKNPETCKYHGYAFYERNRNNQSSSWNKQESYDFLTLHGVSLLPLGTVKKWDTSQDYEAAFHEVENEFTGLFSGGNSGEEKIALIDIELPFVVKFSGDPDYQNGADGLSSTFQEYAASRDGLNGNDVMAKTELFWHQNGFPILVQEKLTNLTRRVTTELAEQLPWLPKSFHSYAQIGQDSSGKWRIYDLDAGTLIDFYPKESGQQVLDKVWDEFFQLQK
jgi:hypothetical protein